MVLAVVEELSPTTKLATGKHDELRELLSAIALTYQDTKHFIFGWSSALDVLNSVTLQSIRTLPALVLINSSDMGYSIWEKQVFPQEVIEILQKVSTGDHEFSGGNSWWTRVRRTMFDGIVS